MKRHVIFRHYASITLIVGFVAVTAVFIFATTDRVAMVGAVVAGLLGFCYFVQQQKLAETTLFKELFTEFNARYDNLNGSLAEIAVITDPAKVELAARNTIVDYFNLCAEEYLFFSDGYIHDAVWRSWSAGMNWYFSREPFKTVWEEERGTNSYYGFMPDSLRK